MVRDLAESNHYKLTSEYETVTLHIKDSLSKTVYVGDFYGDPSCAMISEDETYLVAGGDGLILYWLKQPFSAYGIKENPVQYVEIFRDPSDIWWIDEIQQSGTDANPKYFRFVAANKTGKALYRMNTETWQIEKLTEVSPDYPAEPGQA